jgi:amino acid adenylation domain-containing protein
MQSAPEAENPSHPLTEEFEYYPLTPRQSLVWADEQINQEGYKNFRTLKVCAARGVDADKLKRAWAETLSSHDVFELVVDADIPRQRFFSIAPQITEIALPDQAKVDDWIAEHSLQRPDPHRPLWDLTMIACGDGELVSVLCAHFLICDEISFGLIAQEVSRRYGPFSAEASRSFRSFLSDDGAAKDKEASELDTRAWQQLLKDPPPEATLLGCIRGDGKAGIARTRAGLTESQCKALLGFSDPAQSVGMDRRKALDCAVSTAIFAWINRLSGQRNIVISIALDERSLEAQSTVGLIDGLAFLRVEIDDDETFKSLFKKVVAAYDFAREHSRASLGPGKFVSAFIGAQPEWPSTFCGGTGRFALADAAVWASSGLAKSDRLDNICLRYAIAGSSREMLFDFNDDLYPEAIRNRLVQYFFRILDAVSIEAEQRIQSVEMLTREECESILLRGQGRRPPEAPDFLSVIARQARENPGKNAVEFGDRALTYADLDRATNRLARRLQAYGVTSGSRVAVAMPRGFGELSAFLAVLKAGGAYVPVDSSHPVERVRLVLEDAEPQVLVAATDAPLRDALPEGVRYFELDDPLAEGSETSDSPLEGCREPDQLSYILFTSGSTGRPKGVEVPRRAFSNFLQSMSAEPGLAASDRVIAITTTTFDIAGLELFLPLYVGATVVIADRDTANDPVSLRSMLDRSNISLMQATPATWRLLLEAGWRGQAGLRMLCGGEALSLALARRLLGCGSELWNVYGPTETTVWSTLERLAKDVERITIGHPIDHTSVSLRDNDGRIVPFGTIGEICIGGKGLALGYRGRPDLTAERFPLDVRTGERYYRTGDLGRYLPDGRLECLGRVDHQVKVRGFRIEPADIEAQLRAVPGVQDVLVVALRRGDGDPQLVTYWVGDATIDSLHERAKARLPHYMVPSAYVHLKAFPLTTSGKIDRKQLPAPEEYRGEEDVGAPPRNDKESIIASIWREILELPFVPIDRDFFSLGGTSFRAVQMRTKLQEALGVSLPLRALFEHPTIEGIISNLGIPAEDDSPLVFSLAKGTDPIPWIGLMGVQLYDDLAQAMAGSYSMLAIHIPVRYIPGFDAFPTVEDLARKYVDAIRQHQPKGPYYLLGLCHGGVVAFEAASQLQEAGERVGIVALLDAELPKARRVIPITRILYALKKIILEPRASLRKALKKAAVKTATPSSSKIVHGADHEPVDFPFDGPEIEKDLSRYEALNKHIESDVLVFRASENDIAPGITISSDMGWGGWSRRLDCHGIPSTHLEIVREPHATEVIRILNDARRRVEREQKSEAD